MAAGRIPKPGTEYGPCETECQHRDCAASRKMSTAVCRYCSEPIGYDVRFYQEDGEQIVHALCAEEAAEVR